MSTTISLSPDEILSRMLRNVTLRLVNTANTHVTSTNTKSLNYIYLARIDRGTVDVPIVAVMVDERKISNPKLFATIDELPWSCIHLRLYKTIAELGKVFANVDFTNMDLVRYISDTMSDVSDLEIMGIDSRENNDLRKMYVFRDPRYRSQYVLYRHSTTTRFGGSDLVDEYNLIPTIDSFNLIVQKVGA